MARRRNDWGVQTLLLGVGAGAGFLYFFDPLRGRARRAIARDKLLHLRREMKDGLVIGGRDLRHRAMGMVAEGRRMLRGQTPSDEVLVGRVRAELGRFVSHPHAVEVTAADGVVTIRGTVLERERDRFLSRVARLRGIERLSVSLEAFPSPARIPALQGESPRPGRRGELDREHWVPAVRLLIGGAGLLVGLTGWWRRGLKGFAMGTAGGLVALRALANEPLPWLFGMGDGRWAVSLHKTMHIAAPVEAVFGLWQHPERFPHFMEHVHEVRVSDGRSHWKVAGLRHPVEWDAELVRVEPGKVLEWKTVDGASVEHAGIVRFEEDPDGGTRIDIRMSYRPPAGLLGHLATAMLGRDAKHAIDEDLLRLKSLLEQGKATAHGTTVTRADLGLGEEAQVPPPPEQPV